CREVFAAVVCHVMADYFNPGPADGRVILLRHPRVAGSSLDSLAHQLDRIRYSEKAYGKPGQVDMLAMAESVGGRHDVSHQLIEYRPWCLCRLARLRCHA